MPIFSRMRFYGSLMSSLQGTDPDVILALLGMKLILSTPDRSGTPSELYIHMKQLQMMMEMAGCLAMPMIQAGILVALYEMGHAIYPAAFCSISTCARYGTAMGIHHTVFAQGKGWIEQEERNRLWWAILILDR